MRIAKEYQLSKSELLSTWTLEDIFDANEFLDIDNFISEEGRKQNK